MSSPYRFDRIHLIVLDSVGCGCALDADDFGDAGANTLGHILESTAPRLPNLESLGLRELLGLSFDRSISRSGCISRLRELSSGKDTLTGHWELAGIVTEEPFPVYPDGFSDALIKQIEVLSGRGVLCNRPASGTAVIEEYGQQHLETGSIIVYTSADPVLQIAAHEDVVPIEELYSICESVRSITLDQPNKVARVIARPFIGEPGSFIRTSNRRDYALDPSEPTVLDSLAEHGLDVIGIGKINDIFNGNGITSAVHTSSNEEGMQIATDVLNHGFEGLSFTNLVDFDAKYGHRRDVSGYSAALERFDECLGRFLDVLTDQDLLMITADHGNDPTYLGTDHTREMVPLILFSPSLHRHVRVPDGLYLDVAATIMDNFGISYHGFGSSLLPVLS